MTEGKKYICKLCDFKSIDLDVLKTHLEFKHRNKIMEQSNVRNIYPFKSRNFESFKNHIHVKHHKNRNEQIDGSTALFTSKNHNSNNNSLPNYQIYNTTKCNNEYYTCLRCNAKFTSKSMLEFCCDPISYEHHWLYNDIQALINNLQTNDKN